MATTRIKEKISTLVSSQLPEFVRTDYTTFVAFLEAYYEFLEQDSNAQELLQNIRSYQDVDRTISSFIEYFIKQYCNDIPRGVLYNKKALVKNIQDLYVNKGNEKSYKLLFQILYNKEAEVYYPYQQVLRASDGKWKQRVSVFIRVLVGDATNIVGKNVVVSSSTTKYPAYINSCKNTSNSLGVSGDIFEYFIEGNKSVPINIGDIVEYENFRGEVVGVPTSITIVSGGSGFKKGDILPLTSGLGNGAKLKITKVSTTGAILNAQFISFGIGYTNSFYNFFSPTGISEISSTFTYTGGVATIRDGLNGFVERGVITSPSYNNTNYFAEDYSGEILREFYSSTSSSGSGTSGYESTGSSSDAVIFVQIGAKTTYPGYYENIDGFLSDAIYLEDRDYYQPFSYVLKVDERLYEYKKAVLDILHPAGTKLFGDLALSNNIDLSTEITAILRFLTSNFQDIVSNVLDSNSKFIGKNLSDSAGTEEADSKLIIKPLTESIEISEELTRLLSRPVTDIIDAPTDSESKVFNKNLNETGAYAIDYFLEDYVTPSDFVVIEESASIAVINNLSDSTSTADNGSVLIANYADGSYFAEDYVGDTTVF